MKGLLLQNQEGQWVVNYTTKVWSQYWADTESIPVYPQDASYCLPADNGTLVNFKIIDEFTDPHLYEGVGWGDGVKYAKLIHEWQDDWNKVIETIENKEPYKKILDYFNEKFGITAFISMEEDGNWNFFIPITKYNELPIRVISDTWDKKRTELECIKKLIDLVSKEI